jgi:hypothetical protein
MRQVFVSYCRTDLDIVKQLIRDLKEMDTEPWHDQSLAGGQNWWDVILREIRTRDIFVFALSRDSLDSEACRRELDYAGRLGRSVLPVLVADGVDLNLLAPPLNVIQVVDYRQCDKKAAFALVKSINVVGPARPLPDPLPDPPPVPISYLVAINVKIDSPNPLNVQEQMEIVFELESGIPQGRSRAEIKELLLKMKKRDDLLAKVAMRIDAALKNIEDDERVPPPVEVIPPPAPDTVERVRFCPQCRTQALDGTKFCPNCGVPLDAPPPPGAAPTAPGAYPTPNIKRCEYVCPRAGAPRLVADVKGWLNSMNFDLQEMNTPDNGLVLQIKKRGNWRDFVGMSTALNIIFHHSEETLTVEIAGGKWVDKAAAGAVGYLILPPLIFAAGFGAWEQAKMPEKVFKFIGERLSYR